MAVVQTCSYSLVDTWSAAVASYPKALTFCSGLFCSSLNGRSWQSREWLHSGSGLECGDGVDATLEGGGGSLVVPVHHEAWHIPTCRIMLSLSLGGLGKRGKIQQQLKDEPKFNMVDRQDKVY